MNITIILSTYFIPGIVSASTAMAVTESTVLQADVVGGIEIKANDIILDCNNHKIQGTWGGPILYGVSILGKSNVTIKNCAIDSFYAGVMIWKSASTTIEKNSFVNNGHAVYIGYETSANKILNNYIANNDRSRGVSAIEIESSYGSNIIESNTIVNNPTGILIHKSSGDRIVSNLIDGGGGYSGGIGITSSKNLLVENNVIRNGFQGIGMADGGNNIFRKNIITFNSAGIWLDGASINNTISENSISGNFYGLRFTIQGEGRVPSPNHIYHNNIYGNYGYGAYANITSTITELSFEQSGNYWGHQFAPCFYNYGGSKTPYDSNTVNLIDRYSFCQKDGWLQPQQPTQFFSQIQNAPNWLRLLRGDHNLSSNIIKTVPNGWVLKVATTTDSAGNLFQFDGYQWYGVIDIADGVTGWMSAKNLIAGTEYLSYDASAQTSLATKAATTTSRTSAILQAVDNYYTQPNTSNSLYGGGGGVGNRNNFQAFIQGSQFPKELILAMATQESGSVAFDNEIVTFDYGHGIMQATFQASTTNALMNTWDNRGVGSEVTIPLCKSIFSNDYKKCYANSETQNNLRKPYRHYDGNPANPIYKQYANTFQSISANIKDGFRVIQDKYRKKCPKADILISNYTFTCQDIEKMLTVWGYNGFGKDRTTGLYTGTYLKDVAEKLENLSSYFSSISYTDTDFIQKMKVANAHKQVIRVYSPVTFSVIDSMGRITGLVDDSLLEEIPNSLYERNAEGAVIFFPSKSYRYRVIGTATGTYKFFVDDTNGDVLRSFRAIDIPTAIGEIHEYMIDWDTLDRGERGVTIHIDTNGDGTVDRIVKSDGTLTEIVPPMVTAVSPSGSYLLNATTTVQFTATDASGIATINAILNGVPVLSGQLITLTKPGANILEVTAMDNEGNEATATSTFSVLYNMSGFLLPVTSDGSKVYNQGRSLPVKFELRDVNGNAVSSAIARLYVAKVNNGIVEDDIIPVSSSTANTGNYFRYDTGSQMYIFNLSTNTMSAGIWQLKAVLNSGQEIRVDVLVR